MRNGKYLDKIPLPNIQSIKEELANGITHGLGAIGSLIALIVLLILSFQHEDVSKIVAFGIYGVSLLLLYTFSALYHLITGAKAKKILRILDHVSIYLLIAGSYTPMTMLVLDSFWGTILLVLAWSMAVLGIVYEVFFLGRNKALGVSLYLLMGWVAVFAIKPIYEAVNFDVLLWLFLGGASYSIGVIFYMWKKMPFGHAVWHLFVLFGSASHFICFYKIGDFGWL